MRLLILAAPALLAACAESIALTGGYLVAREAWRQGQPGRPWESITSGHEAPPPLPASLVPSRPDFVFTDEASGRDFELWFYHDHEVVADRVYVRDSGGDRRPATFDEARWAVSYYNAHWRHRTEAERMDYLSRPPAERQAIPAPLLNEHIRLREREVEELAKNALDLEAQLRAMAAVGEPAEKRRFAALKLDETYRDLGRAEHALAGLRERKAALYRFP